MVWGSSSVQIILSKTQGRTKYRTSSKYRRRCSCSVHGKNVFKSFIVLSNG